VELGFPILGFSSGPAGSARNHFRAPVIGKLQLQGIWRNGFDALRALDDDGDGQIADAELKGLALWFDRDRDGRSLPARSRPVEQLGLSPYPASQWAPTVHIW
jgi:hypothetical protein